MAEVVNLNKTRKAAARAKARATADANAAKFGRTKAQKTLDEARTELVAKALDAHRLDPPHQD